MNAFTRKNILLTEHSYNRFRNSSYHDLKKGQDPLSIEKESDMSYQQESYQFLQETRREIDRLTRRIDSLKKVEQLLDGILSGTAPFTPDPPSRHSQPDQSRAIDPELSALPLFSESRRGEKNHVSQMDRPDQDSRHTGKESRTEERKEPVPKILFEPPPSSDTSRASGSWGDLAILALKSSPNPLSLDELVSRISKMEGCPPSNDPRNAIRVALTRRKGDVRREGRGFYQLSDG
ncbi:hypothetical protein [Leptospirillum ferrooxidans]|uniref:Uncharacterized protein n=1 Tax=Leptospirillum ferrooxidans (strain C2-3) TaxID=1162668 RepID=I0IND3_LEPFC|nr:hypothetical protein [Leptospirillum ferrooxidans]BAM06782.1 hypothetical protein LFE_1089 [Leptospirillum ferrooxidans C2-3]